MHDDVETKFDRALDPRTCKSVIGNGERLMRPRNLRDLAVIDDFEQRIARRLDPNHARVRTHLTLEFFRVRKIDKSKIEIGRAATNTCEKPKRSAVKIIA